MNDFEQQISTNSDEKISALLSALPRVNAPANFEHSVKARIARNLPRAGFAWPAFLKLAVPTGALAALAFVLYLSGFLSQELAPAEVVTETKTQSEARGQTFAAENGRPGATELGPNVAAQPPVQNSENTLARANKSSAPSSGVNSSNGKGSFDIASNAAERDKLPKGLDANRRPAIPAPRTSVPAINILRFAGVQADSGFGGWKVTAVVESSPAERAGVKAGDVIEAVNDTSLIRVTTLPGGVELKTIRVRRDGKSLTLRF